MKTRKIYFAAPLFTLAERRFNVEVASAIQSRIPTCRMILPQVVAVKYQGERDFALKMFENCLASIDTCDIVLAILDGADADSGTCMEIGYAKANNKPIIGLRTDFRESEERGLNIMIANACRELLYLPSTAIMFEVVADRISDSISRVLTMAEQK